MINFENSTKIKSCKIKSFYAKPFIFIYRSSIILGTFNNLAESFIVLTVVTERDTQFECWMEDDWQPQQREEFTWTWLKYSSVPHIKLCNSFRTLEIQCTKTLWCFIMCLWLLWGLTITIVYAQYRIWIGLVWPIPRSGRKCQYQSDTDTEYRIGTPLLLS